MHLETNKDANKKNVAIRKILRHYKDINMFPFFKWDLKMLPLMMKWLESADNDDFVTLKLSTIFQFVVNFSWNIQKLS